jgi:hypothetical protein
VSSIRPIVFTDDEMVTPAAFKKYGRKLVPLVKYNGALW